MEEEKIEINLRKNVLTEYIPIGLAFIGIVVCAIVFQQQFIKTLPVCVSLLILLFNARANRIGFLIGAANSMIYIIGYFAEGLYGTVVSTAFGALIQVVSFFQWKRRSYKGNSTQFRVLKNVWRVFWSVGILLAWAIAAFVLAQTGGNQAWLDGLVLVLGFILPFADMFAVVDAAPLKVINVFIQLMIWVIIVCDGEIANLTYVISMAYTLYMTVRQVVRWAVLYREQKALQETK